MTDVSKLLAHVNKVSKKTYEDDTFYYPVRDPAGNGSAVIRFLPAENDDDAPFIKEFSHNFKGPTQKYLIEKCPTTIGRDCPVCAANSRNYETLSKDEARKKGMNRKTSFISRIVVIEDKKTPENVGKVFMFKYGKTIFDKIVGKLQPEFEDETAFNPFDMSGGANFKLKIRKVDNETNYDKSEFDSPSECEYSFEKLKSQFNAENNIQKFLNPENFKSDEDLIKRLNIALGISQAPAKPAPAKTALDDDDEDEEFNMGMPKTDDNPKASTRTVVNSNDDDDDDIMNMVKSLAAE